MATTKILFAERYVELVIKAGTQVAKGELLGYSSGWVKSDADAAVNIYGQYVAMQDCLGDGRSTILACEKCLLLDEDAPWTANTAQYLSGTAGAITETRPATDGDMIQIVGRSLDTTRCLIDIKKPQEFEVFIPPDEYDTTGEPGIGTTDAGWTGPQVDAVGELAFFKGRLPSGLVSLDAAKVIYNSINGSAYDTDVSVTLAYDGASNVQDTGAAIEAGDWEQADTDNILYSQDVLAAFGTTLVRGGANFSMKLDPDGITADVQVIGLRLRGFKV